MKTNKAFNLNEKYYLSELDVGTQYILRITAYNTTNDTTVAEYNFETPQDADNKTLVLPLEGISIETTEESSPSVEESPEIIQVEDDEKVEDDPIVSNTAAESTVDDTKNDEIGLKEARRK